MDKIKFTWDIKKNDINRKKHGVDFKESSSVFLDDDALLIPDPDHSDEEERFLILGMSASLRILVVCHCYRNSESEIRIISARRATAYERRQYHEKRR